MSRQATLTLSLVALLAGPAAHAQDQASLGFGLGIVKPSDIDSTLFVTANYRFRIGDRLMLEPEVGYWKKGEDPFKVDDLNLGVSAILRFPDRSLTPWVGGGLGLHMIDGVAADTETKLGFQVLGGLDYRLTDVLDLFGSARYDLVGLEGEGDLNQFKVYGGLRYRF